MMNKTLIIGCNGQLGSDCMAVFAETAVGVDFPEFDISDRFQCLEKLNELTPKVIVNCAAYTAVDACETDPGCWKVNADGPGHLAEWAEANDVFLAHAQQRSFQLPRSGRPIPFWKTPMRNHWELTASRTGMWNCPHSFSSTKSSF